MENLMPSVEIKFVDGFLEALGIYSGGSSIDLSSLKKALQSLDPLIQKSVLFTFGLCDQRLIPLLELEKEATENRMTIWDLKERGMAQIRKILSLPEITKKRKERRVKKLQMESGAAPRVAPQEELGHSSDLLAESLYQLLFQMKRLAEILIPKEAKLVERSPVPSPEKMEIAPVSESPPEQEMPLSGRSDAARLLRSPAFREDLGAKISFERLGEILKDPDFEKYIKEVLITTYCTKGYDRFSPYKIAKLRGGSPKTIQKWIEQAIDFIRQNA
jgi:hypothetical protein